MWYTKNNLRIAQLEIKSIPDEEKKQGRDFTSRYNHYASRINSNSNNIPFLKRLLNNINNDPNPFIGTDKQILIDKIKELTSSKTSSETTNTFTPESIKKKIIYAIRDIKSINYVGSFFNYDVEITFDQNNYYASVITNYKDKTFPYLFNFKNEDELDSRLPNLIKYLNELGTKTLQGQNSTGAGTTNNNSQNGQSNNDSNNSSDLAKQIKGTENKAQALKLLSPADSDGDFQFTQVKDYNAYNELVNNLILNITVTPNDNEKYFRTINVTPQLNNPNISSNAKNTINEMIEKIKNEAIYQLAKDETGKLISASTLMSNFKPAQATEYKTVAFPIEVPAARDGAVDIFIDGQKIASVKNNTQFVLNTQKYPLFAGPHTLEAKVAGMMNTPEPPVSDRFLKVLSKVRKFDFTLMSDGSINFQNTSNDIESYKPAINYAGEGLASKVPVKTINLLADQLEVIREPYINNYITLFMTNSEQKMPEIINNWKQKLRALSMEQYNDKETRKQILRDEIKSQSDKAPKTVNTGPVTDNTVPLDTPNP